VIAFLDASALIYLVDGYEAWSGTVQLALQELAEADPFVAVAER
jgi:hypothetical protein